MRTTLSIPDPLLKRLRLMAAERGISMAELVREALGELVDGARPRPASLGIGASRRSDTARLAGESRPEPRAWR